jgi:hypothetical protein
MQKSPGTLKLMGAGPLAGTHKKMRDFGAMKKDKINECID